jgi:hypothetical protein
VEASFSGKRPSEVGSARAGALPNEGDLGEGKGKLTDARCQGKPDADGMVDECRCCECRGGE